MTIRQKLIDDLFSSGLWRDEAEAIVEKYLKHELSEDIRGRIDEDAAQYPSAFYDVVWLTVKPVVVEWIDENKPNHWLRRLFA